MVESNESKGVYTNPGLTRKPRLHPIGALSLLIDAVPLDAAVHQMVPKRDPRAGSTPLRPLGLAVRLIRACPVNRRSWWCGHQADSAKNLRESRFTAQPVE